MKDLRIITTTVGIHFLSFSFLLPLLPDLAETTGLSPLGIMLLESSFPFAHIVGILLLGHLRRVETLRWLIPLSLLLQGGGFGILAASFSQSVGGAAVSGLFAARLVGGLASAILPTALIWTHRHVEPTARLRAHASIFAAVTLGAGLGPFIAGWLGVTHLSAGSAVIAVVCILGCVWSACRPLRASSNPTDSPPTNTQRAQERISKRLVAVFGGLMLLVGVSFAITRVTLPFFLHEVFAWKSLLIGLILTTLALLTFFTQISLTRTGTHLNAKRGTFASLGCLLFSFALIDTTSLLGLLLGLMFFGVGIGAIDPFLARLMTDSIPENTITGSESVIYALGALSKFLAPPLAGLILQYKNSSAVFLTALFFTGLAALLLARVRVIPRTDAQKSNQTSP